MDDELRQWAEATRSQLKATQRSLRTSLQMVTDFLERLDAATPAQSQEDTANGYHRNAASQARL